MRVVKKLDPELTQLVQSTTTINSIEDIVKELIENSIDANSNNIQIIITHYKESLNIECIDNGDGISPNDLELVGDRFCTSKFQSTDLKNLQNVTTFGFRGEALNSILNICSTCIINSKTNDFRSHFQVMFNNDKRLSRPSISSSSFSHIVNNGTSILINDVFGNLPVRKLSLSKISWPQLSINLRSVLFKSFSFKPDCKFKLIYKTEQKTEFIKHSDNNNRNILTPKKLLLNKQGEINLKIIKLNSINENNINHLKKGIELERNTIKKFKLPSIIPLNSNNNLNNNLNNNSNNNMITIQKLKQILNNKQQQQLMNSNHSNSLSNSSINDEILLSDSSLSSSSTATDISGTVNNILNISNNLNSNNSSVTSASTSPKFIQSLSTLNDESLYINHHMISSILSDNNTNTNNSHSLMYSSPFSSVSSISSSPGTSAISSNSSISTYVSYNGSNTTVLMNNRKSIGSCGTIGIDSSSDKAIRKFYELSSSSSSSSNSRQSNNDIISHSNNNNNNISYNYNGHQGIIFNKGIKLINVVEPIFSIQRDD
ncbi:hypothetical protein B5S28_g3705 [[Candida] boidinii]|nr:hypothetical protein B5S28_g3705 [[Candida] boidinii]